MIFRKPRLLGMAIMLGIFAIIMRESDSATLLSIATVIVGAISIVQEYQQLKKP